MTSEIAAAHRAVSDARVALDWSRTGLAGYEKRVLAQETGLEAEHLAAAQEVDAAQTRYQQAREAYRDLATAEPPLWSEDGSDPLVLLPLRLETVYRGLGGPEPQLWIRAYPDDIHVDSHETGLTAEERAATEAYWVEVWTAGPNEEGRAAAWSTLVAAVGPGRAAWAVRALRPQGPRPETETPPDMIVASPEPWVAEPTIVDSTFTRAAHSYVLPDRLVFSGYETTGDGQIGLLWRQEGEPIDAKLDVGPAPGKVLPPRWLGDFDEAVRVGMGVRVPLTGLRTDFSLVTVTGVRGGGSTDTAQLLTTLLEAHRCTDGLAVLPTGTPTNNTDATRSAWHPRTPPEPPDRVDEQHAALDPRSTQAAARAATALGRTAAAVLAEATDGLTDDEHQLLTLLQTAAGAFSAASSNWRTLEGTDLPDLTFLVSHYIHHVRGRGLLPTLRVGNQPYGLLPVTSLDLWHGSEVDLRILNHISGFRTLIESQAFRSPGVGAGGDPDQVINDLLHRLPASRRLRYMQQDILDAPFDPPPDTPIGTVPHDSRFTWAVPPSPDFVPFPVEFLCDRRPTPEMVELARARPVRFMWSFWQQALPGLASGQGASPELLQRMLALSSSTEAISTGRLGLFYHYATNVMFTYGFHVEEFLRAGAPVPAPGVGLKNGDLVTEPGFAPQFLDWLTLAFEQLAAAEDLSLITPPPPGPSEPPLPEGADLPYADTPRLELLLCEALDTQTHRLDAWMSSVAHARLAKTRATRPDGTHLGAYGWVADLHPRPESLPPEEPLPGDEPGTPAEDGEGGEGGDLGDLGESGESGDSGEPQTNDGYLLAPSLHHAVTAAVLRSGWLSHTDRQAFAVDLSAARVRRALAVVDGVRSGQSLGALLGYRFERGLHDNGLDALVAPVREAFPMPRLVDPSVPGSDEARTAIAARDVVDGLALLADWRAHGQQLQDILGNLPPEDLPLLDGATTLMLELEDTLDAVGDLLLAESVHQLVAGSPLRAASSADGITRGDRLPQDFEVVRTPRAATALTHRVAVLAPHVPVPGWDATRPLAQLEPAVERWCEARLGDPGGWRFDFGDPAAPLTLTLADLGVCALDVVLGAGPPGNRDTDPAQQDTALARRLLRQAAARAGAATVPPVTATGAARFAELRLLCNALAGVLAGAKPLLTSHLDQGSGDDWAGADLTGLAARVETWHNATTSAVANLVEQVKVLPGLADAVSRTLDSLADLGVTSAYSLGPPTDEAGIAELRKQAVTVLNHFAANPLAPLPGPPPAEPTAALGWVTAVTAAVSSALAGTLPVLAELRLGGTPAGDALTAGPPEGADEDGTGNWLVQMERVRPNVRALDDALAAAEVLADTPPGGTTVVQLPAGQPWIARGPAPVPSRTRPAARHSALLRTDGAPDPDHVAGLLIDSWTESVPEPPPAPPADAPPPEGDAEPSVEELGGLAFHYNQPDARAPQALLVAVPPDPLRGWRMEDVHAIVEETFAVARIRGLDLNDLTELRGLLPVQTKTPPHQLV
ncbi:hypothetical protein ACFC58_10700 [Kitasatospora purpeofusca]|uniref:hypothetical protein n=1 Tax=Kitasatospora purpeofusca TaxID=67352 RepID=UPI0035DE0221